MEKIACRLLLFAKAPIPGKVKTRLVPALGPLRAAALHEALVLNCLKTAVASGVEPVELWCAPSVEHPFFGECAREFSVRLHQQADGDIGRRMGQAFEEILKDSSYALLMGTDSPAITRQDIREAASILCARTDAAISPAEDGGYVLIGLRRYASELFTGISWGTDSVLEETRQRLRRLSWRWRELPTRWDVDRPEDMERLVREGYAHLLPPPSILL